MAGVTWSTSGGWLLEKGPRIRRVVLLALLVGVPVFFLRGMLDPFNVPKLAMLMCGTTVVLAIRVAEILQGASADGLKRVAIPALAIVSPLLVAWFFSDYRSYALFGYYGRFQGLVPYFVVALFGVLLADAFAGRPRQIAWALVGSGAFVGLYGLMQRAGADPFSWSLVGGSSVGNPNFVGGYLGMVLPLSLGLWLTERDASLRRRLRWMGVLVAIGLVTSISQGGWAAGAAGAFIVLGALFSDRWRIAPKLGYAAAALTALVVVGSVLWGIVSPTSTLVPITVRARGQWWVSSVEMAKDHPIVGIGPSGYGAESFPYRTFRDAYDYGFDFANDPHSVALSFLVSAGVIGFAGFLAAMYWGVREGRRASRDGDLLAVAFLGAMVAYIVQSLVSIDELTLRVSLWGILAGIVALLAQAPEERRPTKGKKKRRPAPTAVPLRAAPVVGVLLVGALAACAWTTRFVIADTQVQHGIDLFREKSAGLAQGSFRAALGFRDEYEYRRHYIVGLADAANAAEAAGPEMLGPIDDLASYLDGFPHANAMVEVGGAYFGTADHDPGMSDVAMTWYERAAEVDSQNPLITVEIADVLLAEDEHELALELLEPEVERFGEVHAPIWGALALVHVEMGDRQAAEEAIKRALAIDPGDSRALQAEELVTQLAGSG